MKRAVFIITFILFAISASCAADNAPLQNSKIKLKVYYFHPDERCPIDQSVESNTRNLMETSYREKIKAGIIEFLIINTDDKANGALISNFDINAQALYVVKVEKGKEIKNDLTKFAFDYGLSNPLKFKKGLKDEIEKNLK